MLLRHFSVILSVLAPITICGVAGAAPDDPTNISPPNNGHNIEANPALCLQVNGPPSELFEVELFSRDVGAQPAEDFTIIALPDTQFYSQRYPEIFYSQTNWIIENREALNIVFVTHEGDVVQVAANAFEWGVANTAMSPLDDSALTNLPEGIPYGIAVGNHDEHPSNQAGTPGDENSTTELYNALFPVTRFEGRSYYGGHYGTNNDNHYELFSAGGMDFIIIHHEFDDTFQTLLADVMVWTNQVLATHADRRAIVSAHSLLCTVTTCPDTLSAEFSNQGLATYDALKDNPNLFLMLCGHASTSDRQPRRADVWNGNTIHTVLANYQRKEECPFSCGNGWLRIMTFSPANDEIEVKTYSPWLDQFKTDSCKDGSVCHEFTLPYDMEGGIQFASVGTVSAVPGGSTPCVVWPGRERFATYEWYGTVKDASSSTVGPRWTFTSDGSCTLPSDCEDGDVCTTDSCENGRCTRSAIQNCCATGEDCDDGNYCTDDSCNANVCSHGNNSNACNDFDPCTVNDVCTTAICSGLPLGCDDGNACTSESCAEGICASAYVPVNGCCSQGSECDDGDVCTLDTCDGAGNCVNTPDPTCCLENVDCDDGNACSVDTCSPRNSGALFLDGEDDHMTMGAPDPLGFPVSPAVSEFTIECWFRWDGGGTTVATSGWAYDPTDVDGVVAFPLVTKGRVDREDLEDRNVNYFLGIDESGVLAADFEEGMSGSTPGKNHAIRGVTPITLGEWHHAAATYDGRCWQLYLDGSPETSGANCPAEQPAQSRHHAGVGTAIDHNGWMIGRFGGLIDEVRIWSAARRRQQILADMNEQIEAAPHLLARWGLNEISGGVTPDSTGNGNLGLLVGATLTGNGVIDMGGGFCSSSLPTEVLGVSVDVVPDTTLTWIDQAGLTFDVAGGLISELRTDGGPTQAQCLEDDAVAPGHADLRMAPPVGDGYYYLTRSAGPCDNGTYGFGSSGERFISACP